MLLLWRDKFGLFWVVVFPLVFAIFFGSIFSDGGDDGPSSIKIAVVDQDSTEWSGKFVSELDSSESFEVVRTGFDDAKRLVRKGKVTGYVLLESGFDAYAGPFFGGKPPVRIGIDPSRKAEAGYMQGILTKMLFVSFQERMLDADRMTLIMETAESEIDTSSNLTVGQRGSLKKLFGSVKEFFSEIDKDLFETDEGDDEGSSVMGEIEVESIDRERSKNYPQSPYDISFPQAILWGLIGCAATFAVSIVIERTTGTLLRLRLAPISRVHILAGKGVACFISCIGVMVILLLFGKIVYGVNLSHIPQLVVAICSSALCFVGIMMFMSVLGRTERAVAGSGWSILMVMSMIGGAMVPVMFMPGWMKTLSTISPVRWAIYSLEGAIWRDFSLMEMMQPVVILLAIGVLFFSIGATIIARSEW
jgi:ABC-2 type transport system permease protein